MSQQSLQFPEIEIHAPTYNPWIPYFAQWKREQECQRFQRLAKIVHGTEADFTHWQYHYLHEKMKPIFAIQETSRILTSTCHKSPFVHSYHLCIDDISAPSPKDCADIPILSMCYFGKKACSGEVRCLMIKNKADAEKINCPLYSLFSPIIQLLFNRVPLFCCIYN